MSDDYAVSGQTAAHGDHVHVATSSVQDGQDLTQWEKIKAGLEPVRVAEVVRSVLLVASVLGFITSDQVDGVTNAVVAIVGGVLLIVSVVASIKVRQRVTPVNKLDGGH